MLDFQLSPQQLKLQQKAREFALKEILPVAWYYDEIDETPLEVLKKAHAAGLINGDIPKKYGGKGWGLIESVLLCLSGDGHHHF
jgi:acyl-CoA dehydrogenase